MKIWLKSALNHHTIIKIVRLSVTVGNRGKRRAARGWLSASQQQTLSGRAARVYTPIGAFLFCLGGHGLHCSSAVKLPKLKAVNGKSYSPRTMVVKDLQQRASLA